MTVDTKQEKPHPPDGAPDVPGLLGDQSPLGQGLVEILRCLDLIVRALEQISASIGELAHQLPSWELEERLSRPPAGGRRSY